MRIIDPTQARPELDVDETGSDDDARLYGRVGLLSNSKPNAGALLQATAIDLGLGELTLWSKTAASIPAPDDLLARLAADFDSVLVAIGD
jgi:hypothetical protein